MEESKRRANARYIATLDRIMIQPPKADGAAIRSAAAAAGQSVQRYILDAVATRMAAEGATSPIEGPTRDDTSQEDTDTV